METPRLGKTWLTGFGVLMRWFFCRGSWKHSQHSGRDAQCHATGSPQVKMVLQFWKEDEEEMEYFLQVIREENKIKSTFLPANNIEMQI